MTADLPLHLPENLDKLFIAFSGGIDSSVLLHRVQMLRDEHEIVVWHIHHGLQTNADETEQFARQQAHAYGLEFRVDHLHMGADKANLEARARDLRYSRFAQGLQPRQALLTAHHQNDQAETLLLNLMRGAGSAGLRGIAREKKLGQGLVLRPLLDVSRQRIEHYAVRQGLEWMDDPSNGDDHFDRNYLRHEVIPLLQTRWPAAIAQLQRVTALQQESEQLHEALAQVDFTACHEAQVCGKVGCLRIDGLMALTEARRKNLIRYWIGRQGLAPIGFVCMQELLHQLMAKQDAMPQIEGKGYSLRCYQQRLYLLEQTPAMRLGQRYELAQKGELQIEPLHLTVTRDDLLGKFGLTDQGQTIELRFRRENTNQPQSYRHRLKRLFQRHRIPPWQRDRTPQVWIDDELLGLLPEFVTS